MPPLVVDPVITATSGAVLLKDSAVDAIKSQLLPLCFLITPNIPEALILSGETLPIQSPEDMKRVARKISLLGPSVVLLKGGHCTFLDLSDRPF